MMALIRFLLRITVSACLLMPAYPALSQDSGGSNGSSTTGSGSASGGMDWYNQLIKAEKKAGDSNNQTPNGTSDTKPAGTSNGSTGATGPGAANNSNTSTAKKSDQKSEGASDKKANAGKDGDKKADAGKDGDKKADAGKDGDKKADAGKDGDKKSDSADSDKKTANNNSDSKADSDKKDAPKEAYDPMKDALFDIQAQKYDDGIAVLQKVLTTNPKNASAHYLLAISYVMKRQYPLAAEQYKTIIKLTPNSDLAKRASDGLKKIEH